MKRLIKIRSSRFWSLLLLISLLIYVPSPLNGQKKERTRLRAYYEKLPNSDKKISIILTQGRGKSIQGIQDALISLKTYSSSDSTIEMASLSTDSLGEAVLFIEPGYPFSMNEEGYSVIELNFDGNDSLRGSKRTIEFMDLNLDLSLEIVDSVKYLEISTVIMDLDGNPQPVEELKLNVGVERLYNNLYLSEVETDEDGFVSLEFPYDVPGDADGMISVVVRLEDHDDYGTVTKIAEVDWGVPVDHSLLSNGRSLFGDSAPIWMIVAVAIILTGAWFHFLWAVFMVFRIKKLV